MHLKIGNWFEIELYYRWLYIRLGRKDLHWSRAGGLVNSLW